MIWLQENWIVALVVAIVAIAILWWLLARRKPEIVVPPVDEPAKPAKPLEPAKPDIVVAEPARFKPRDPAPAAVTPPPAPKAVTPTVAEPAPVAEPSVTVPEEPAPPPAPAPKKAVKKAADKTPKAAKVAPKAKPKPAPIVADASPAPAPAPAPSPAAKTDNLQLIKGVGPKMVGLLNGLGVTSFSQIAAWTDADVAAIDPQLGTFQGRIARDNIVDQAGYLARGDKAGFEAKYGALGGEL